MLPLYHLLTLFFKVWKTYIDWLAVRFVLQSYGLILNFLFLLRIPVGFVLYLIFFSFWSFCFYIHLPYNVWFHINGLHLEIFSNFHEYEVVRYHVFTFFLLLLPILHKLFDESQWITLSYFFLSKFFTPDPPPTVIHYSFTFSNGINSFKYSKIPSQSACFSDNTVQTLLLLSTTLSTLSHPSFTIHPDFDELNMSLAGAIILIAFMEFDYSR